VLMIRYRMTYDKVASVMLNGAGPWHKIQFRHYTIGLPVCCPSRVFDYNNDTLGRATAAGNF